MASSAYVSVSSSSSSSPSKQQQQRRYRVIVIGAGISGLAAAQLIQEELVKTGRQGGGGSGNRNGSGSGTSKKGFFSRSRGGKNSSSNINNKNNNGDSNSEKNYDPTTSVLILEARERIGGRIYTYVDESVNVKSAIAIATPAITQQQPMTIDLGATWIHGSKKSGQPLARLATKLGEKIIPDFVEDIPIYRYARRSTHMNNSNSNQKQTNKAPESDVRAGKDRCHRSMKLAKAYGRDMKKKKKMDDRCISMKEALDVVDPTIFQDPIATLFLKLELEFDVGGPIETISTQFDNDEEFDGDDYIPLNGYKPIIDDLAKGLTIQCSTVVKVIKYDIGGVEIVTTTGMSYKADRVICTVPLGVLKSGSLTFEPGLSESKREAIDRIGWGTINKVGLVFDHVFWPKQPKGFGVALVDSPYNYIINKYAFTGMPVLEAYSVGNDAIQMATKTDDDVITDILNVIGTIFQCNITTVRASLVKRYIQRWGDEVYTRGAYSYSSLRTRESDFTAFEKSQLKVLFFAGEHANVDYRGAAHGAYLSGRWTGRQVLGTL
jgi:polyamine oxidase